MPTPVSETRIWTEESTARAATLNEPDADPFDLLCHLAFNGPLRTRRERAERVRRQELDFFRRYGPEARAVLNELLDKYAVDAAPAFAFADALQVPPISKRGNLVEIADLFGGAAQLQQAVTQLQNYLYAN